MVQSLVGSWHLDGVGKHVVVTVESRAPLHVGAAELSVFAVGRFAGAPCVAFQRNFGLLILTGPEQSWLLYVCC